MWSSPRARTVDLRGGTLENLVDHVHDAGIVKVPAEDETECIERLLHAGAVMLPQYESVRSGAIDDTVLETVASARAAQGATSASKSKDTEYHHDGYQFQSPYRARPIAGISNLPDVELLAFPKVVERRYLCFADLARASRALLRDHEGRVFEHLTRPTFSVDSRYRDFDPELRLPAPFSVAFSDELGCRFHIGGSVESSDPEASFALSLFRTYLSSAVTTERLESGVLYVVNQRLVAHKGIRIPSIEGKTLLRRRLLKFAKEA